MLKYNINVDSFHTPPPEVLPHPEIQQVAPTQLLPVPAKAMVDTLALIARPPDQCNVATSLGNPTAPLFTKLGCYKSDVQTWMYSVVIDIHWKHLQKSIIYHSRWHTYNVDDR